METGSSHVDFDSSIYTSREATFSEIEQDALPSEVYLSVVWQQKKLGAAFYDSNTNILHILPDCLETSEFSNIAMLLQQVSPSVVIMMAKTNKAFADFLRSSSDEMAFDLNGNGGGDGVSVTDTTLKSPSTNCVNSPLSTNDPSNRSAPVFPYKLETLANQDFGYMMAKQRLSCIHLPDMPQNMSDKERHVYLSSILPFDSIQAFCATGALLKYLNQKRVCVELEEASLHTPVVAIKHFNLTGIMLLDRNAFYSLQIFSPLSHPSVYKAAFKDSGKEGLSLRLLFQSQCKSTLGRKTMSLWLLRPLQDLDLINERLTAVAYFADPRHSEIVDDLQASIKKIRDVSRILFKMVHAPISLSEWKIFRDNLRACNEIVEICRRHAGQLPVFSRVIDYKSTATDDVGASRLLQLVEALDLLVRIIDFDKSATEGRCVVKPNVDQDLDEKRRIHASLHTVMDAVAKEESVDLMQFVSQPILLIYEPQWGFFVTIRETEEMRLSGSHEVPTLQFRFIADGVVHYKSQRTLELDEKLGDVYSDMRDKEVEVLLRLQNAMLHITDPLLHVIDCISSLDCLLAFATCAVENKYIRPILTEKAETEIFNGRHPLQEHTCNQFIPNDTKFGEKKDRVILITGPNSSGKSVFLKQTGLIVYMAHLGSFVPAEAATISLTDRIFTRIKSVDSVSLGLSAFLLDVNQVIPASLFATKKSLVILDEFGKGTGSADGTALLAAFVNRWLRRPETCPKILISTHLLDLMSLKLIAISPLVKYMTTEVTRTADGRIVFLYKLVPGQADGSYAAYVAQLGGLADTVVARAKEVTESYSAKQTIPSRPINQEFLREARKIVAEFLAISFTEPDSATNYLKKLQSNYSA